MVWTSETGICDVAVEERRWPPIWKAARGIVVIMTSLVGYRTPCRNEGMCVLSVGKIEDSQEKKMQKPDTNANCIRVRVAGLRKALRIDFEEVLVRALEKYQMIQRTCGFQ